MGRALSKTALTCGRSGKIPPWLMKGSGSRKMARNTPMPTSIPTKAPAAGRDEAADQEGDDQSDRDERGAPDRPAPKQEDRDEGEGEGEQQHAARQVGIEDRGHGDDEERKGEKRAPVADEEDGEVTDVGFHLPHELDPGGGIGTGAEDGLGPAGRGQFFGVEEVGQKQVVGRVEAEHQLHPAAR